MKNLDSNYYNPAFSHIYVERKIFHDSRTRRILANFADGTIVEIEHYKDMFCRGGQNASLQHRSQKLILASKTGELVYQGAPVCQSFGNEHFYYASCVMNCIYDCEYCYLKGMYPSGNLVVFVNVEDIFCRVDQLLREHPVYLCVSYDTDLLALEGILGYVRQWTEFAAARKGLRLEIRTKSANIQAIQKQKVLENVIYAFTMSPEPICEMYEQKTPGLAARIQCAAAALEMGHPLRLCFDPMIYCRDWKRHYENMLEEISARLNLNQLQDVSVGSFRVSGEYLKKMRKIQPDSGVVQFPFQNDGGYYHYPDDIWHEMEDFLVMRLKKYISEEKIYLWKEEC